MRSANRSKPLDNTGWALRRISRRLARDCASLSFRPPVAHVYAPLVYAREPHERYLALARAPIDALFLGMNPGPFGMAQTGVPFGEVASARDFLGLGGRVRVPDHTHPKRPIEGFDCARSEVSGRRFWGLMAEEFGTREAFFSRAFVWNWCPLAFLSKTGANLTPDKLPARERAFLAAACDQALLAIVEVLRPRLVIGVGAFAEARARQLLAERGACVSGVLHPSPASPAANRGWANAARRQLRDTGFL